MTVVFQSSPTQKKISNLLRLLAVISSLTLSSLSYLLSLLLRNYPLIRLRLTRCLLYFYKLLAILALQYQTTLLLPQLDYSSQFRSLKTINLNLQTNFLHSVPSYLTFDPFSRAPITSNFSPINLFLDTNIAVNIIQITHGKQNDPASIRNYNTFSNNQNSQHGKYSIGIADEKNIPFKAQLYPPNGW